MRDTMAKAKCEEIIIDQYLKGNINNQYKNAALLELKNDKRKSLIWILERALGFGPDYVVSQLKHLQKVYYIEQCEALEKKNKALIKELKKLEHELSINQINNGL